MDWETLSGIRPLHESTTAGWVLLECGHVKPRGHVDGDECEQCVDNAVSFHVNAQLELLERDELRRKERYPWL